MEQWGEPLSLQRYQKFVSVLRNLIDDKRRTGDPRLVRAITEWEQDLEVARFVWEELAVGSSGSYPLPASHRGQ